MAKPIADIIQEINDGIFENEDELITGQILHDILIDIAEFLQENASQSFENALTESLGVVKFGGDLTDNTVVSMLGYSLEFNNNNGRVLDLARSTIYNPEQGKEAVDATDRYLYAWDGVGDPKVVLQWGTISDGIVIRSGTFAARLKTALLTSNRNFQWPNKSGTLLVEEPDGSLALVLSNEAGTKLFRMYCQDNGNTYGVPI